MAKTPNSNRRYREDLSEMPDWLKKKTCPNRDKYLSGKRILPKNLTGKEKLADVIDNAFWRITPRDSKKVASFSPRRCSSRM